MQPQGLRRGGSFAQVTRAPTARPSIGSNCHAQGLSLSYNYVSIALDGGGAFCRPYVSRAGHGPPPFAGELRWQVQATFR
ncbi:hypothetical protein CHELA40_15459 [Chelatococcus asaccharovorans]|nr:hypothetical protein CHELA17_60159 [Chelatococcus asaccharovorans]CAH1682578.1 hypothetical protein CHELA40_15459 [Chelatococcus asaccharovorans]